MRFERRELGYNNRVSSVHRVSRNAQGDTPQVGISGASTNVWSVGIGLFVDENGDFLEVPDGEGGCKNVVGFRITVTEKVDQNTLPLEDRIPDMLEGVPVQIIETPNDWLVPNQ